MRTADVKFKLGTTLKPTLTIAAIAKNEERYLVEWLAYHFAVGADRLIVFSNESEDEQLSLLRRISAKEPRLTVIDWVSPSDASPQVQAYNTAFGLVRTQWISFIDIDEFMVPVTHAGMGAYLESVPSDVSSIHVNWRNFGSSNVERPDYDLVTRTFDCGPSLAWGNHHHFKSIARVSHVERISIHNIQARSGKRVLSDFSSFETEHDGLSNRIVHHPLRLHHYQCKTFLEFSARMRRGDANFPPNHPDRYRDGSQARFAQLDLNEVRDETIRRFDCLVDIELKRLRSTISD